MPLDVFQAQAPVPATPATPPALPVPAVASQAPAAAAVSVPQPHQFPIPANADRARWLEQLGRQLSSQIESARSRRTVLARQYEAATGANRAGLEQQLAILDQRIAQLEVDIAAVGVAKTQTFPSITTPPAFDPGPFIGGMPNGIFVVLGFILLLPVSFAFARRLWRRPKEAVLPPNFADTADRLERLEQAIETIAIEIERVAEGQRYVSKILSKQSAGADANGAAVESAGANGAAPVPLLGPVAPEPIGLQQGREEVRVRRS